MRILLISAALIIFPTSLFAINNGNNQAEFRRVQQSSCSMKERKHNNLNCKYSKSRTHHGTGSTTHKAPAKAQ